MSESFSEVFGSSVNGSYIRSWVIEREADIINCNKTIGSARLYRTVGL
jgi:hypothetical protein